LVSFRNEKNMDTLWKSRKFFRTGAAGSTFAYALAQKGLAGQICVNDANPDFAEGQALDLAKTYLGKLSPEEQSNVY